ncbi:MAG TPA: hypothetical protein VHZ32_00830, partial [Rhizomicrobium sp.]|nr:hypothetical protein [Rhizomicrobium sp.]
DVDLEPSLGAREQKFTAIQQTSSQESWAAGATDDREHDEEREVDKDDESWRQPVELDGPGYVEPDANLPQQ